jgi:26S proteasome regulatory subunit N2
VRYGACMALAIGCSAMDDPAEALALLEHLKEDKTDFVRQGALLASSMLLMQQNPETNAKAAALRAKLAAVVADGKHASTMTRMGAILGTGVLDAGGRNVCIELMSRSGFPKPPAMVGMLLWCQYWYWYPMMHMLSLSLTPTALVGVNKHLDLPLGFAVECEADLRQFDYPKPLEEKKEKKQQRVKTVVLSTTAKAKARAALKKTDSAGAMETDDGAHEPAHDDKEQDAQAAQTAANEAKRAEAKLTNPLRVTRHQAQFIKFKQAGERYQPVYKGSQHKAGIVVLHDSSPEQPAEVLKVAVPPTAGEEDDGAPVEPPQPFEWTEP